MALASVMLISALLSGCSAKKKENVTLDSVEVNQYEVSNSNSNDFKLNNGKLNEKGIPNDFEGVPTDDIYHFVLNLANITPKASSDVENFLKNAGVKYKKDRIAEGRVGRLYKDGTGLAVYYGLHMEDINVTQDGEFIRQIALSDDGKFLVCVLSLETERAKEVYDKLSDWLINERYGKGNLNINEDGLYFKNHREHPYYEYPNVPVLAVKQDGRQTSKYQSLISCLDYTIEYMEDPYELNQFTDMSDEDIFNLFTGIMDTKPSVGWTNEDFYKAIPFEVDDEFIGDLSAPEYLEDNKTGVYSLENYCKNHDFGFIEDPSAYSVYGSHFKTLQLFEDSYESDHDGQLSPDAKAAIKLSAELPEETIDALKPMLADYFKKTFGEEYIKENTRNGVIESVDLIDIYDQELTVLSAGTDSISLIRPFGYFEILGIDPHTLPYILNDKSTDEIVEMIVPFFKNPPIAGEKPLDYAKRIPRLDDELLKIIYEHSADDKRMVRDDNEHEERLAVDYEEWAAYQYLNDVNRDYIINKSTYELNNAVDCISWLKGCYRRAGLSVSRRFLLSDDDRVSRRQVRPPALKNYVNSQSSTKLTA